MFHGLRYTRFFWRMLFFLKGQRVSRIFTILGRQWSPIVIPINRFGINSYLICCTLFGTRYELHMRRIGVIQAGHFDLMAHLEQPQPSLAHALHGPATARVDYARELLGGNGILLENHIGRFVADAEAIYSYEGTREMNTLIVGKSITGLSAFV